MMSSSHTDTDRHGQSATRTETTREEHDMTSSIWYTANKQTNKQTRVTTTTVTWHDMTCRRWYDPREGQGQGSITAVERERERERERRERSKTIIHPSIHPSIWSEGSKTFSCFGVGTLRKILWFLVFFLLVRSERAMFRVLGVFFCVVCADGTDDRHCNESRLLLYSGFGFPLSFFPSDFFWDDSRFSRFSLPIDDNLCFHKYKSFMRVNWCCSNLMHNDLNLKAQSSKIIDWWEREWKKKYPKNEEEEETKKRGGRHQSFFFFVTWSLPDCCAPYTHILLSSVYIYIPNPFFWFS